MPSSAFGQVTNAPVIVRHPTNVSVTAGQNAILSAEVSGSPVPVLQWRFNGGEFLKPHGSGWYTQFNNGTSSLYLYSLQVSNAGAYTLVASNVAGVATSEVAMVSVDPRPAFTLAPTNVTVVEGRWASFNAQAFGEQPWNYQWYFKGEPLSNQVSASLTFPSPRLTDAGQYQVVVTNVHGAVTSSVSLTVTPAPTNAGAVDLSFTNEGAYINALVPQSDGKLLVAQGYTVIRYSEDGTRDSSFYVLANGPVRAVALLPNGQILVGGQFTTIAGIARQSLARLNGDGSVDTNFIANWEPGGTPSVYALGVQKNGSIFAAGQRVINFLNEIWMLHHFRSDGSLGRSVLPTFSEPEGGSSGGLRILNLMVVRGDDSVAASGANGCSLFNPRGGLIGWSYAFWTVNSLHALADGRLLLTGNSLQGAGPAGIARLVDSHTIDETFAQEAMTNGYSGPIAVQTDGKIQVPLRFTNTTGGVFYKLVRLHQDGSLDPTFDTRMGFSGSISNIALAKDGSVYVAGSFGFVDGAVRPGFARLLNDATTVPSIHVPPTNTTARLRTDATFYMLTACSQCEVQWQHNGTNVPNATGASLFLPEVHPGLAGEYAVIVRNGELSVTSAPVTLIVVNHDTPGAPDLSFNTGGGVDGTIRFMHRLPDGRVIVAGDFRAINGVDRSGLARLLANGEVDQSFNVQLAPSGVSALAVTSNGQIYASGKFTNVNGIPRGWLARLYEDGDLDHTFQPTDSNIRYIVSGKASASGR